MATVGPYSSVSRTASTSPSAATRCAYTQFCICIAIPRTGKTGCLGGLADSPAQPKSAPGSLSKNAFGCGHGLWLDICVARTARGLGQRDGRASPSSRRDRPTGQVQPNVAGRRRSTGAADREVGDQQIEPRIALVVRDADRRARGGERLPLFVESARHTDGGQLRGDQFLPRAELRRANRAEVAEPTDAAVGSTDDQAPPPIAMPTDRERAGLQVHMQRHTDAIGGRGRASRCICEAEFGRSAQLRLDGKGSG